MTVWCTKKDCIYNEDGICTRNNLRLDELRNQYGHEMVCVDYTNDEEERDE